MDIVELVAVDRELGKLSQGTGDGEGNATRGRGVNIAPPLKP